LFFVVGIPKVPLDGNTLTLGVTHYALAVTAKLRVVTREQHEPGQHAGTELVENRTIAVVEIDLPMGGHGAEIDNTGVGSRLDVGIGHDSLLATKP
jgi:hypothetical protein